MFGKEARSFLKELGQRVKSSSGYIPYGTTISGAADVGGCTKRKHCCSAREHWTEGQGLVVLLWRVFGCCVLFLLILLFI